MRSSKSRSRNKSRNNNNRSVGNIVNRVFDSSGPEGKVRGTPQQIIEKYNQLARDAQLSGDRVALENFQQHAEHYTRMLAAAQKEQDARREQQEAQQAQQAQRQQDRQQNTPRNQGQGGNDQSHDDSGKDAGQPAGTGDQPDLSDAPAALVETPEGQAAPAAETPADSKPARKPRSRARAKAPKAEAEAEPNTAPVEKPAAE